MRTIQDLPEDTADAIRDKLNCYTARVIDLRNKRRGMELEENALLLHRDLLWQKLAEKILAGATRRKK